MASTAQLLILLLTIIGILSISATARPCKTLFISSYSFSFKPLPSSFHQNPNPNANPNDLLLFEDANSYSSSSSGFVTIVAEITQSNPTKPTEIFLGRRFFPAVEEPEIRRQQRSVLPFGFSSSYDFSSLRDRTKDILSVVVALLFGVGCGALTAATMYLVWTLFANRYDYRNFYDELDDGEDDDDVNPKKIGYVKLPASAPVDSVPAPVKEAA